MIWRRGYLKLLLREDYRSLWLVSLAATAAEVAVGVTITWGVWESTGSATAVGLLIGAISLPRLVLETFVGRLVDTASRRSLMILGAVGIAIMAIVLLVISHQELNNKVVAIILIFWMLPAFSMILSRARSSYLPRLIPDQVSLVQAQALLRTTIEGMSLLAGAVALLLPVVGSGGVMAGGIVLALGAGLAACRLPELDAGRRGLTERHTSPAGLVRGSFGEPLAVMARSRFLRWFVFVVAVSNIPHSAIQAMLMPIAYEKLQLGVQGYGVVEIALSLGVVGGYLALGRLLASGDAVRWSIFGLVWSGILAVSISLVSGVWVVVLLFAGYGLSEGFFLPAYAKFDLSVPDEVRGRVNALFNLIVLVLTPISQVAGGIATDLSGVSAVYFGAGMVLLVMGVIATLLRPHQTGTKVPESAVRRS